jgi:hypothetical protein
VSLQWIAVHLRTGEVRAEFPDLQAGTVTETIGQYDSTTVAFPVTSEPQGPPANWVDATQPGRSMLVGLDPLGGQPVWGGIVFKRTRVAGARVQLSVATPGWYLTRRFIRDTRQYPAWDRLLIAQDLLQRYVIDGAAGRNGLPLRIDLAGTGQAVDGDWKDTDDKQIYTAFQDLGLEWRFGLEWQTAPTRVTPVAYLAERLGRAATAGYGPAVTLDWPGNLTVAELDEDYSTGAGANDVMATSTGQGEVRPQSDHQLAVAVDMATFEDRYSAGNNITRRAVLNADAAAELSAVVNGTNAYTLGISQLDPTAWAFDLGDDLGVDLAGPEFPDHPQATVRAVGRQIDDSTVTPILTGAAGA